MRAILYKVPWAFLLVSAIILQIGACNFSDSKQRSVNDVTEAFALTNRTFIGFFQDNLKSCNAFFEIYDELSEDVVVCDDDTGTFQVTKESASCDDGPPLVAQADFTVVQDGCKDTGTDITSTGTFQLQANFSPEGNIGIMMATDLIAKDLGFTYTNFWTRVDLSDNNLSCSDAGDMTVSEVGAPDETCGISSNCRRCNL